MDKAGEKGPWNVHFTKVTVVETYRERLNLGTLNTLHGAQTAETPNILHFHDKLFPSILFLLVGNHSKLFVQIFLIAI